MKATATRLTTSDELLDRLSRIEAPTPTVISCYIRLDRAARDRRQYLVDLLNRIRELERGLDARGVSPAQQRIIHADIEKVVRRLARLEDLPHLPGAAVFACSELDLFELVPLVRVHRNRIDIDTRPLLHELLDAQETLGHYLAVAIDRMRARFFHIAAAHTEELSALVPMAHRGGKFATDRQDAPGWGEHRYSQRIEAEKHRHYAATAREIGRLLAARPYRGVAIFGPKEHAEALRGFLPARIERLCLGVGKLNPTAVTPAQIAQATWQLQWQSERRDEARLLARIEEGLPSGRAVNGLRETLRAMARGQVRELLVPDDGVESGFRCRETKALAATKMDCRGSGEPDPVPNLIDHVIEDALRQRVQVVFIDDPKVAERIDGLAATLRFKVR